MIFPNHRPCPRTYPTLAAGYHVRLDAATTAATRLLFCTTGILLRRLASDAALARVSHVIVDEARPWPARAPAHAPTLRATMSRSVCKAALLMHDRAHSFLSILVRCLISKVLA
jgi:membrane-bound metal-dependent hydrolase YbcI (DUF457 family)